jgi:hypothetical protein
VTPREMIFWGGVVLLLLALWFVEEIRRAPVLPAGHPEFDEVDPIVVRGDIFIAVTTNGVEIPLDGFWPADDVLQVLAEIERGMAGVS